MTVTLHNLPPEVIHEIFAHLELTDVGAFRRLGQRYAVIGEDYLASRLRFFTETESLARLETFAKRSALSKGIKTIIYEGNLLGHRSKTDYLEHFKNDHHADEYPQMPENGSSNRTIRHYNRSLSQWQTSMERKFELFQGLLQEQQSLLHARYFSDALSTLTDFPNLESLELSTEARCSHRLSRRFMEKYPISWQVVHFNPDPSLENSH
jgi:hypothetical protein